jgi:transposase
VVLFQDESGYCRHPKLGRMWAKRGQRPVVRTRSQRSGRLNLFGWVNPLTGEHGVRKARQGNTEAFLEQLQELVERFRGKIVDLWVDNASWHKGPRVREFLAPYQRWFHLHYHPPYHPELNPQERIWRRIRYEETTNHYYASPEDLEHGVLSKVASWSNETISSLCHIDIN